MSERPRDNGIVWSAEEVSARLGISTCAFSRDRRLGAREIAEIAASGIKRIEISGIRPRSFYDCYDQSQIDEIRGACDRHGVRVVSMHVPVLPTDSEYEPVRKGAVEALVDAVRKGAELGAAVCVGHFGTNDHAERSIVEMLEQTGDSGVTLVNENLSEHPSHYLPLCDRVGSARFGFALDIGHATDGDGVSLFTHEEQIRPIIAQCASHLRHLHLHDFGDEAVEVVVEGQRVAVRDHNAPFTGHVRWRSLFAALAEVGYSGELMFEAMFPSTEEVISWTADVPRALFAES